MEVAEAEKMFLDQQSRRASLSRTPPGGGQECNPKAEIRCRSESVGSGEIFHGFTRKRTREDAPEVIYEDFKRMVNKLNRVSEDLDDLVMKYGTTKVEIKQAVKILSAQMRLMNQRLVEWVEMPKQGKTRAVHNSPKKMEIASREVQTEEQVGVQTSVVKISKGTQTDSTGTTSSVETQTEESYHSRLRNKKRDRIEEIEKAISNQDTPFEELSRVIKLDWPEELFKRTKMTLGGASKLREEGRVVIVTDADTIGENPVIGKSAIEQVQVEKIAQGKLLRPGGLIFLKKCTEMATEQGAENVGWEQHRTLVGIDEKAEDDINIKYVYEALKKVNEGGQGTNITNIAFAATNEKQGVQLRKLIEQLHRSEEQERQVEVYGLWEVNRREGGAEQPQKEWHQQRVRGWSEKNETLIVRPVNAELSYANILREMRKKIDIEQVGIRVKSAEKTVEGNVKLKIVKRKGNGEDLKKAIEERLTDVVKAEIIDRRRKVYIIDLDEETSIEEVQEAVQTETKGSLGKNLQIKMSAKPNTRKRQYAELLLPPKEANELLSAQRIKVGWSRCRIVERMAPVKCFRCLEFGHYASECRSAEERRDMCLKCGERGHQVKECENGVYCYVCRVKGHRADGMSCPTYSKLMVEARKGRARDQTKR